MPQQRYIVVVISSVILLISALYRYHGKGAVSAIISSPVHGDRYDYIVVGAGTAGCVVASRLSERTNVRVLLVEAGSYFDWWSAIPLAAPLMQGTKVDWAFKTVSQKFSSGGYRENKQSWPRGKGLGGSGQLNYLAHSYGIPDDYGEWPDGWSYADLLPYMKQASSAMSVESVVLRDSMLGKAVIAAQEALRHQHHGGRARLRAARRNCRNGSRWSTYQAYLQPAWNRRNLHILVDTLVTKMSFEGLRARGICVRYKDGSSGIIGVEREIILSAGAIGTPHLLMLSGIGPARQLLQHQIPAISVLPEVGGNLFDHLNLPLYVDLRAPVSVTLHKILSFTGMLDYLVHGSGPLASNGILATGHIDHSGIMLCELATADEKLLKDIANYETQIFRKLFPSCNNGTHEGFIYMASCLQPKSRGSITLESSHIEDSPRIDPAYLVNSYDVKCTQKAIKLALKTLRSEGFVEYGARVHVPDLDACRQFRQDYDDPNYSECVLRMAGMTGYHPAGTCRMGTDNKSVVDESLRVRGVEGLRIMDASVLPSPISGTPNSVLIAMAERASDVISSSNVG